jgi:hypothetical protein
MRFDDMQSIDKVNAYYVFPTGLVFTSMSEGDRGSDGRDAPEKEIRLQGLLQRCQARRLVLVGDYGNNDQRKLPNIFSNCHCIFHHSQ